VADALLMVMNTKFGESSVRKALPRLYQDGSVYCSGDRTNCAPRR